MEQEYIDVEWRETEPSGAGSTGNGLATETAGDITPVDGITYERMVAIIDKELQTVKKSFMSIGCYLKRIRDYELYKNDRNADYRNIEEFAKKRFHISKSTTYRLIQLCEEFSFGQNSPQLDENYSAYSYSQLIELLSMKPEQREKITPEMTVEQIRQEKSIIKKEERKTQEDLADAAVPKLKSNTERKEWLENIESWKNGLWYEDKKIGAKYYKTDFPDGCRLIAVRYRTIQPGMNENPGQDGKDSRYSKTYYHMLYSDWYLLGCPEEEYKKKSRRDFMDAITPIPELVKYLSGREHNDSSRHFVEFDTRYTENVNDKNMPYLTRKYIKYFIKHGYVPQYFSPYDGVGDFTIAPTQATSSGSYTGMGAITIFRLDENIQWLMADQTADPGLRAAEISKLRKAAEKPTDTEVANKNREIGLIKFFVRKTTAEQIFEIMGIPAEYVEKCKAMGLSDAAIARLAGNGIVPGVVEASFRQLYGTVDHPGFLPEKD